MHRTISTMTIALAATAGPCCHASSPGDWPCFQGPDRNGVVADADWVSDGAEVPLWTADVGAGYSCPSIAGGRLVTMGYDAEAGLDSVICLDAATGVEVWRHSYPAEDSPNYHTGGTLTTPAIHDGIVYVVNRHGLAHALGLERGDVLWQRDYRADLELPETFHGYCASPLVLDDRIVYVLGGVAAAANRADGAVLWSTEDYGDGAYANASLVEKADRLCAAVMLAQTFLVLDVADGTIVHEAPWELSGMAVHVAAPLVMGDRVFLSTAYNKGCALLELGDAVEPRTLWSNRRMRNKVTGCFRHGDHIYGFDESMLKCIDMEGNEAWRVRGLGMGALAIAGNRLLVLTSKGELIVAEATPEAYRELSRRTVLDGGVYWTMPVLSDGLVYVRNSEGELACLDHRTSAQPGRDLEAVALRAPGAEHLFETHARAVGGDALRAHSAVRLSGTLEILARGLTPEPMTLTLAAPNRWDQRLVEGGMTFTFDGRLGWADEPRGVFLFEGDEKTEAPLLFAMHETFAPRCPVGAVVEPKPVQFGDRTCWKVVSSLEDGRALAHFFEAETGRLVGREGDSLSTLTFGGAFELDGVRFPARITRFRAGNGQEEAMSITAGAWLDAPDDIFAMPDNVRRLQLSPEEVEAINVTLRARFSRELGWYKMDLPMLPGDVLEIVVRNGQLASVIADDARALEVDSAEDGRYVVTRTGGATIEFVYGPGGEVTGLRLRLPGPDGPEAFLLPRLDEPAEIDPA
jgi:outer membrane protein assembly factor BamB